jgi:hypothetical protein
MNSNETIRIAEHARLVELAKHRAADLRTEAIRAFWTGAGRAASDAARAARRYAASLARHARLRSQVEA